MFVALVSAKGSPGVTTAALCLAAAAAGKGNGEEEPLVVEADPAGGDVECWTGPHGEPGLVGLATALRPGLSRGAVVGHAVETAGVRVVTAPTTEAAARVVLSQVADRLAGAFSRLDGDIVGDFGRWSPSQPTAERLSAADVVLVVCRPTLDSVEHARGLVASSGSVRVAGAVVVGGNRPYGPAEIASALGVRVVGVLPWEPRAVFALLEDGTGRRWQRSRLADASAEMLDTVRLAATEARSYA